MIKVSKRFKKIYILLIIVIAFIIILNYAFFFLPPTPIITDTRIDDYNNISVTYSVPSYKIYKDVFCLFTKSNETPLLSDPLWTLGKNNTCTHPIDDNIYNLFIKSDNNEIIRVDSVNKLGKVLNLKLNKEILYLQKNNSYKISAEFTSIGNVDKTIIYSSSNDDIATVDNEGVIKGINNGRVMIIASLGDVSASLELTVTNLIASRPSSYDYSKPYLGCNYYSKEDNDLLDEILRYKVNEAGYATRAGAVEAARFITLDFPYRIAYFSENGRMGFRSLKVDGEGRYYHKGLYLNSSRFSQIQYPNQGPGIWGCNMYNRVSKRTSRNGLDCSGFVSWVLLNGGFDPGDIGAGITNVYDLTDTGKRVRFNKTLSYSNEVKTGDLLSSGGYSGGHIAIIVGIDDNYYYVAESLWTGRQKGVVIMPYHKSTIFNRYYYVILMDSYYKEDGNYTKLWY